MYFDKRFTATMLCDKEAAILSMSRFLSINSKINDYVTKGVLDEMPDWYVQGGKGYPHE